MLIDWRNYNQAEAKKLAEKFGAAAVAQMMFNISQLSLVDTGNLLKSIKYSVRSRDGFVERIEFIYEWYGKFHEVGASNIFGNGKSLEATHWRSDSINKHKPELDTDFAEFFGDLILKEVELNWPKLKM